MGNSLLPEEHYFIGFLPLQTYIDNKKTIKSGTKCPPERENLVRSMIIRYQIEELKCTYEVLKQSESTSQKEEIKETENIFA